MPPHVRANDLIQAYLGGEATEAELSALDELIREDDAVAARCAAMLQVHALLVTDLEQDDGRVGLEPLPFEDTTRLARSRRSVAIRLALAACVLLAAGLGLWSVLASRSEPAVAELVYTNAVSWATDPPSNRRFEVGREYVINEGVVAFRTQRDATAVIEGPAAFVIRAPDRVSLGRGRLTAHAPSELVGELMVECPFGTVTDFGTEFLVRVDDHGGAGVFVSSGTVCVQAAAGDGAGLTLATGQSASFGNDGLQDADLLAEARASTWPRDVLSLLGTEFGDRESEWTQAALAHTRDSSLLVWLDAGNDSGGVTNRAIPGPDQGRVLALGGRPAAGRLEGSDSIEFGPGDSPVELLIPGGHERLTIAAWVRFDPGSLPAGYAHRGLLMSDRWGETGAVHFQAKSDDFRLTFAAPNAEPHAIYDAHPDAMVRSDWAMLAAVYDAPERSVTLYLNGTAVARHPALHDPELVLGRCLVGATLPNVSFEKGIPMGGQLDDLMVWSRALEADELRSLYEAGSPRR